MTNSKADKPVVLISGSNWNLECWFLWREENQRTRRKTLGAGTRTNNKLNPHVMPGPGIEPGPRAAVEGERSHHCAIPAPLIKFQQNRNMHFSDDFSTFCRCQCFLLMHMIKLR